VPRPPIGGGAEMRHCLSLTGRNRAGNFIFL
jgi:hypothetical protein